MAQLRHNGDAARNPRAVSRLPTFTHQPSPFLGNCLIMGIAKKIRPFGYRLLARRIMPRGFGKQVREAHMRLPSVAERNLIAQRGLLRRKPSRGVNIRIIRRISDNGLRLNCASEMMINEIAAAAPTRKLKRGRKNL